MLNVLQTLLKLLSPSPTKGKFRDHQKEVNLFKRRGIVAIVFIVILLGLLMSNLFKLQVTDYQEYTTRSNDNSIKVIPIPPSRGIIYDRHGIPIAVNKKSYQLEVEPNHLKAAEAQFTDLKSIVGLTDEDIANFKKEIKSVPHFSLIPLKYNLTEQQIDQFMVNQYRFPYFHIKSYERRYYPYGAALESVTGYVSKINEHDVEQLKKAGKLSDYAGTDDIGKSGVEKYYESILHGKPGYEEIEVNSRGQFVRLLNKTPPQAGENIYLTIDANLQKYIVDDLAGKRGAVVVMDPKDSGVLALVTSPTFDPNLFVNGISNANYTKLLKDKDLPLINRAVQGTYPPGSTVKPYIAASALADGTISINTITDDPGWWQLPNSKKRYRDWNPYGHGKVNVVGAIAQSVDTFFYRIAYAMGIDKLSDAMQKFGFGTTSGLDTTGEKAGIMPTKAWKMSRYGQPWYLGDTIPVGIGQGYWTATPIEMAKALVTLINNGKITTPHLLLKTQKETTITDYQPVTTGTLSNIPQSDWNIVKKGMYEVLYGAKGTARWLFQSAPYKAAGKSGTSQVYSLENRKITDEFENSLPVYLRDHALFIAYAPFDDPKVAVVSILENAGSGATHAGPVARKVLDYALVTHKQVLTDEPITQTKEQTKP